MPFDSVINQINQHADNSGFIAALDEDLYEPRPNQVNLIKAILLRLDMEQQDESVIKTYTGRITIEHNLLARYKKLNLAPYKGFINPKMTLEMDEEGEITDVVLDYEESYVDQMLRYSDEYGTL